MLLEKLQISQNTKQNQIKSNITWIDKGSEFYNKSMKPLSEDNDTEAYSTQNEGKPAINEIFLRTLEK